MKRAPLFLFLLLAGAAPVEDEGFDLVRGAAPQVRAGARAQVSLSVVPRAGHRLLADGPILVKLRGDGVRPLHALYRRDDAVDPRADVPRFELGFTADRPGAAHLEADCVFYLCKGEKCRPVETRIDWLLDVAP